MCKAQGAWHMAQGKKFLKFNPIPYTVYLEPLGMPFSKGHFSFDTPGQSPYSHLKRMKVSNICFPCGGPVYEFKG